MFVVLKKCELSFGCCLKCLQRSHYDLVLTCEAIPYIRKGKNHSLGYQLDINEANIHPWKNEEECHDFLVLSKQVS